MDPSPVLDLAPRATTSSSSDLFLKLISDPFGSQVAADAVLASVGVSIAITFAIALLFCFLRPLNNTVYAPRLRFADEKHAPPAIGRGPFAWFRPVLDIREQLLVEKVGLDAAVFIRFTKMCRNIFLILSLVGCGILIPVNYAGGNALSFSKNHIPNVKALMRMTPQYIYGQIMWAMVACAYLIDFVVCFFLWTNYRAVTRLRRAYLESKEYQSSLHSRTLMVTEIPISMRTDDGVVRIVDGIKNMPEIPKAVIARNIRELPKLIEEHEETVRELEKVLAKFLRKGTIPSKRPMTHISKNDPQYVKGNSKVDAIEYLTNRIKELETKIKLVRGSVDQKNSMSFGFASYDSVEEAHTVAYAAQKEHPHGATVRLAPRPSDIIWDNLPLTSSERRGRAWMNDVIIALLTLVWTVPNALIAVFLQNLSNLGKIWPAFDQQFHENPKTWAVIQGVLAPALTSAFYLILPILFRRLRIRAGDLSKTSRERHVFAKLYAFFTLNNLVIFSLFGTFWSFFTTVKNGQQQGESLGLAIEKSGFITNTMIALCYISPFWISWVLQRNLGAAIDLSQLVKLAWGNISRKLLSPTPREMIELTAPPPFDYANYYNYFLFYATVALCFACFQPIILPVTAFYFLVDSYLKKYLILYVFYTKHESGGQFWRPLFNRFLFALLLSNVMIALLVFAQGINWVPMLGAMAPLPVFLAGFKIYCKKTYDDKLHFFAKQLISNEAALDDGKSRRSTNVAIRFGHPALYKPLMTPMVSAKSQHLLSQVYLGRIDDDDEDRASLAGYDDAYSMTHMAKNQQRNGKPKQASNPFEFVADSEMDFSNYKNRADFRDDHGGDGVMYGRAEDIVRAGTPSHTHARSLSRESHSRPGTPSHTHARSLSRGSDLTLISHREGSGSRQPDGTVYPAGYHRTPSSGLRGMSPSGSGSRDESPSNPIRGWGSGQQQQGQRNLVTAAAPMGRIPSPLYTDMRAAPYHEESTPNPSPMVPVTPGQQPLGEARYDYFRGRSQAPR